MDTKNSKTTATQSASQLDETVECWRELLDRAFTGWEPADQAIERLIDRVGDAR